MTAFSPGPWQACHNGECTCGQIWSLPADAPIARVHCRNEAEGLDFDLVTVRANARLVAAAPKMYDRLKRYCETHRCPETEALLAGIDGREPAP